MTRFRAFVLSVVLIFISCNHHSSNSNTVVCTQAPPVENSAPLSDSKIADIDSLLMVIMEDNRFNGNALVAIEGYPIFEYCNGYADLYKKTPLNSNTTFQIASVSKGFTSMAVLILADRGLLKLNDTVQNYIPEFPFERITINQLLNHTSGLQNYMYFVDNYWDKEKPITNEDVLKLINEHNPQLNFTPGRRHLYNNTGYAILALLVERISGKRFYQFLEDEIFDPLGMDHTFGWNKNVMDTISNIASGFTRRGWRYRKFAHNPLDEILGDKSVYTTTEDLLKWDQALYSNTLISDTLLQKAFTKAKTSRGSEFNYGYGWRLNEKEGKKVIYHHGLWNGFTSSCSRYVDDKLTIIMLNNTNAPAASIVRQIHDVMNKELHDDVDVAMKK